MLTGGNTLFSPWDYHSPQPEDLLLCFFQDKVLLAMAQDDIIPRFSALSALLPDTATPFQAFSLSHRNVYTIYTTQALALSPDSPLQYVAVNIFRELPNQQEALLLISAWHTNVWHCRNRFCGACGAPLSPSQTERALCCAQCGQIIYPTISPAVSISITHGDYILLVRNARSTFQHFSLVAGYVEVGETLEETVSREVMEEVGLTVANIRYVASQPWGLSQAEMIGFHAELEGSDTVTLQTSELSEARWFHRSELTSNPNPISLSFEMIERFRKGVL